MDQFSKELSRFHRSRLLGRAVAAGLCLLAILVLLVLAAGFGDAIYAFTTETRELLRVLGVAGAVVLLVAAVLWACALSRRKAAGEADRLLEDPRGQIAGTQTLVGAGSATALTDYLAERAKDQAAESLKKMSGGRRFPWRTIGKAFVVLLVGALSAGGVWFWNKEAVQVVGQRLLWPDRDIPPYSAFRFELGPESPNALFGGEVMLTASITGNEIVDDVICLVRNEQGEVQRLRAFRESDTRFARRIENVVTPLEVAFSVGKARSEWMPVDVLFQPRIVASHVKVRPPVHTGLPTDEYPVEENELHVLEGSEIELSVSSNRPLAGGKMSLVAADRRSDSMPLQVKGEPTDDKTVTFRWKSAQSGALSVMIHDVRSTRVEAPLELNVVVKPDEAPVVDLVAPDRVALATPGIKLPLAGEVEDDFGLSRVQLVRTLVGYRDRGRMLADTLSTKNYNFEEELDLKQIGVEPGQILEFYLEATDRNPTLLGVGTSEVVRVAVISEEEYAERIRSQTTLKEFAARYQAVAEAVDKARKALDEMEQAMNAGDVEAAEKARKEAAARHEEAAALLKKIEEDFPAFALEERLKEAAKAARSALEQNLADLKGFQPGQPGGEGKLQEMKDRLGGPKEQVEEVRKMAKQVEEVGKVMEMAARFRNLYNTQNSLSKRFGVISTEMAKGITRNRRQLESLAKVQDRNREALKEFRKDLEERAKALPDEFESLRLSVEQFLQAMDQIEIESPMQFAAEAGRNGQAVDASTNSELAKLQMEQLMSRSNSGFCQMCQGGGMPQFKIPLDCNMTMAQMMAALLKQGGGQGMQGAGGTGGGFGGTGQDGFAMGGNSLNIPAYGPDRMKFQPVPTGASGRGQKKPHRGLPTASETDTIDVPVDRRGDAAVVRAEAIPEAYREAVKRYFTRDDDESLKTNPDLLIPSNP